MSESHWLAQRAQTLLTACLDPQTGKIADPKSFSLYLRYQTTHERAFNKALTEFQKLRFEKRKQQAGFEAQKPKQAKPTAQERDARMEKASQINDELMNDPDYRDLLHRISVAIETKSAEFPTLNAEFERKYGAAEAEMEALLAQAA